MSAALENLAEEDKVTCDPETTSLHVPHIGMTLRVLLAVAAEGYKTNPKRTWKIVYRGTVIGSIRIKDSVIKDL
jgi:hypothetical protein